VIVAFQPGGSVKDARVVLKPDELIPDRFNTLEAIVYRENSEDPRNWILVKPKFTILPSDSPLLSQPKLPEDDRFSLTTESEPATFEHADIIRMDEDDDKNLSGKPE
jgi:hypothetical protein